MWWSDEEWAALADPDTCGMCADAHLDSNQHSVLVASSAHAHLRLVRNQAHPGYCVVVLRAHVTDMADLTSAQLGAFWSEVQRAGRAIDAVFTPCKIDYLVMGHRMPHLHCHLLPQHPDDDPLRNVDIADGPVLASDADLRTTAERIRCALPAS